MTSTRLILSLALFHAVCGSALAAPRSSASPADRPDHARCATWQLRDAVGAARWAAPGLRTLPCDQTPVGPPPNPQVGDSWNWYLWRLNGFPTADLRSCTVRGMGAHCYVVVEDSQWNVHMNQAQVDSVVDAFENHSLGHWPDQGIWQLDTTNFGLPPDNLDQDPRVYFVYYDFDIAADGFFWAFDQECDDVAQFHSNETDVVYLNDSDFDPAGSYMTAVLAHEFEHLIQYNYDQDEAGWVDEGIAEVAMWLYGHPDTISQFNTNPDHSLTTFNGNWYDYIKSYLFNLYFYERYGGQAAMWNLVHQPLNGIQGYDAVLDQLGYTANFPDVFSDWVVANYLDDTTIGDGRFGYAGETLPPFNPFVTYTTYPVGPNSGAVQHWAADYARYLNGSRLHMTFDGADLNSFKVRALLLDPVNPTEVVDMTLNGTQTGTLPLPQLGSTHDECVMVYASASDAGGTGYTYGAGTGVVDAPSIAAASPAALALDVLGSVSARPTFALAVPAHAAGAVTRLEIFDVAGRLVRRLLDSPGITGRREVTWTGLDEQGTLAAPGTYFVRLSAGEERATSRVVLRR
ncbi:MAG: FlgD immunoglobulin-like domain containing protein [bacterium]